MGRVYTTSVAEAERWDQVYASEPHLYTRDANALLIEVAGGLTPGTALDIGMGEGRNARYLASLSWDVTGVDVSREGTGRAREQSATIHVVHGAIEDFDLGTDRWDLILGMYVHGVMLRESARVVKALRPGGLLVIEGFHRDVMKEGVDGLSGGLLGYTSNALLRHYLPLRVLRYEETRGLADWRRIDAPLVRMVARKE
jgi:SAM-dependent methyltransferase